MSEFKIIKVALSYIDSLLSAHCITEARYGHATVCRNSSNVSAATNIVSLESGVRRCSLRHMVVVFMTDLYPVILR